MPPTIRTWVSPFSPFSDIAHVADAYHKVHLPGVRHRILLPTLYGSSYQGNLTRRTLGTPLCGKSVEDYARIRSELESVGVPVDGWGVPTYDGSPYTQGVKHGQCASLFDFWMINFEHGWADFWTPDGADGMNAWISGFWDGVADKGASDKLSGCVGVTMVTCSAMMLALDNSELRAWVEGTNFIANEAYIPGDPGLDPAVSLQVMGDRLSDIGRPEFPVTLILERGDLPTLCAQYMDAEYGVQIWTLEIAAAQTWPDVESNPPAADPCVGLINALGWIGGDLLKPVVALKARQPAAVQALVAGIQYQCDSNGISHA